MPGIAHRKLEMICDAWTQHQQIRHMMLFLQVQQLHLVYGEDFKTYDNEAINVVKDTLYQLAKEFQLGVVVGQDYGMGLS